MTLLIANDGPLPPEWLDHPLTGDWTGSRECHIGGDFLLIYTLDDSGKSGLVVFVLRDALRAVLVACSLNEVERTEVPDRAVLGDITPPASIRNARSSCRRRVPPTPLGKV
jgi:addiction module RelE/StbE family toxin